jgi:hypothetical protein
MDAFLDNLITFIDTNQTAIGLVLIFFQGLLAKVLIAIDKIHEIAKKVTTLTDTEKMAKATDDIVTIFGAKFTWLLLIPGVKTFLQFLVQYVFDRIKTSAVKNV